MLIKFILYFLLLSPRHLGVEASLKEVYYQQIDHRFPSTMDNCHLHTLPLNFHPQRYIKCATFCLQNANCHLFCIKGDDCILFSTWVTTEYVGTDQYYGFNSCHSSWFYSKNLATTAVVTMPSPYSANHAANQATNGYYCYLYDSCSVTNDINYPWWQADLQKAYVVSAVIVKPRDDYYSFINVEIRFGNSSVIGQNPLLGTHPGTTPPPGTVLTFKPPIPMEGRYLTFQSPRYGGLSICEVQIVEA
ncbi:fucolectin-like [Macrobrachium nipponense]|uniref:fucolectin-like n=1 Tax=Macrobrachium nipponense TaxID=159736 RepID=UPI0030C85CD0